MAKYQHRQVPRLIVEAELYTDPASVDRIMDMIGTRGVNNSPEGLYIFRDHTMVVKKTWFVVKYTDESIYAIDSSTFLYQYKVVDNQDS